MDRATHADARRRRHDRGALADALFCMAWDTGISAIRTPARCSDASFEIIDPVTANETSHASRQRGPVVVILPKSRYLLKVVELPKVAPEEVRPMLRLEVEALLGAQFAAFEFGYRRVASSREGYDRFELYICRTDDLASSLERLEGAVEPDYVLPSALAWSAAPEIDVADVLVASDDGALEVASREDDDTISVRAIDSGGEAGGAVARGFVEHLRSMLGRAGREGPLRIAWLGTGFPERLGNGQVTVDDRSSAMPDCRGGAGAAAPPTILRIAADALRGHDDASVLGRANMLPQAIVRSRAARRRRDRMLAAAICLVAAVVIVLAALTSATWIYQREGRVLAADIERIRADGEIVGRRMEQIRAVRAARVTGDDLVLVLRSLYEATPDGLYYSEVNLDPDGRVRLHGHAEAAALPFELPEALNRQPALSLVRLSNTGQKPRGGGTITEFRIDCRLVREARP
ncbi:MAG: hypothetical protein CMJ18_04605 [Phycisphaeraceae bacterium]|nr:hypothetical protein [Phycisphaeraceae bacterium]